MNVLRMALLELLDICNRTFLVTFLQDPFQEMVKWSSAKKGK